MFNFTPTYDDRFVNLRVRLFVIKTKDQQRLTYAVHVN